MVSVRSADDNNSRGNYQLISKLGKNLLQIFSRIYTAIAAKAAITVNAAIGLVGPFVTANEVEGEVVFVAAGVGAAATGLGVGLKLSAMSCPPGVVHAHGTTAIL